MTLQAIQIALQVVDCLQQSPNSLGWFEFLVYFWLVMPFGNWQKCVFKKWSKTLRIVSSWLTTHSAQLLRDYFGMRVVMVRAHTLTCA